MFNPALSRKTVTIPPLGIPRFPGRNRIAWLDTLKGLGIIFIVVIHATGNQVVRSLLFSVAVPIFIFVSGFLFNGEKLTGWTELVLSRIKTRLLPYALWVLISYVITMLENSRSLADALSYFARMPRLDFLAGFLSADFDWLNGTVVNGPLWFLPCLFLIEIMFYFVARLRAARIVVFLAAFSLGSHLVYSDLPWKTPFILNMAMTHFFFFGLGFIFKKITDRYDLPRKRPPVLLLWALAGCLFIGGGVSLKTESFSSILAVYVQYLVSLAGIITIALAAKLGESIKWLRYLGTNTLIILVLCEPARVVTCDIFSFISFSFFDGLFRFNRELFTFLQVLCVLMLLVPLISLINRFPFLVGKSSFVPKPMV